VPIHLQGKLLKAVETKEVKRLGSDRTYRFDVRIISLSNRDPALLIDERKFRLDLFYRISSLRIHIPPLRERPEDIDILADYFTRYDADRLGVPHRILTSEAMTVLKKYSWPGNVRELESFLDLLMITTQSEAVEASHVVELLSDREVSLSRYDDAHGALKSEVIPYYFGPRSSRSCSFLWPEP
jgi:transcriptional regulator with PAS, ATPase and Fis domain